MKKVVKKISEREYNYQTVVKELVKRYIMRKQQRDLNSGVTEDDLNEIKQDISGLRFELLEIFKKNEFKVDVRKNPAKRGKRGKLNLEKTMSKNMFDDEANAKRMEILFDTFNTIDEKTPSIIAASNSGIGAGAGGGGGGGAGGGGGGVVNTGGVCNSENELQVKRVPLFKKRGSSSLKEPDPVATAAALAAANGQQQQQQQQQVETKSAHVNSSPPSMFKVALKLKKLTENKLKKTSSDSTVNQSKPMQHTSLTATMTVDEKQLQPQQQQPQQQQQRPQPKPQPQQLLQHISLNISSKNASEEVPSASVVSFLVPSAKTDLVGHYDMPKRDEQSTYIHLFLFFQF